MHSVKTSGYPWEKLNGMGVGAAMPICGVESLGALRVSASVWGKASGGRVRIEYKGDEVYLCTLLWARKHEKRKSLGRPTLYPELDALEVGKTLLYPWEHDERGGYRSLERVDRACDRLRKKGVHLRSRSTPQGLVVYRTE